MWSFESIHPSARRARPRSSGATFRLFAALWLSLSALSSALPAAAEEPEATGAVVSNNPVPVTEASIARGRTLYLRRCQTCHGYDGRALENIDFEAADLTTPSRWRFGTREGDIFRTTHDGAAEEMPPFRSQMTDEEIWHVVNYVRSLWSEEERAKVDADEER